MDRAALVMVFTHILDGYDIPKPESAVRVRRDSASLEVEGLPYSLLTNLAHANLWQSFWLRKLAGGRKSSGMAEWKNDFRVPEPGEFEGIRAEFLAGLQEAARIAASEPFAHQCESDDEAIDTLVRIAVHGAYHLGQMNLLRRAAKGAG